MEIILSQPILEQRIQNIGRVVIVEADNLFLTQGFLKAFDIGRRVKMVALNYFRRTELRVPIDYGVQKVYLEVGKVVEHTHKARLVYAEKRKKTFLSHGIGDESSAKSVADGREVVKIVDVSLQDVVNVGEKLIFYDFSVSQEPFQDVFLGLLIRDGA